MLNGYKTYIVAALIAIVTFLFQAGFIELVTFESLCGFLGAGGLVTLRAGVKREAEKTALTVQLQKPASWPSKSVPIPHEIIQKAFDKGKEVAKAR